MSAGIDQLMMMDGASVSCGRRRRHGSGRRRERSRAHTRGRRPTVMARTRVCGSIRVCRRPLDRSASARPASRSRRLRPKEGTNRERGRSLGRVRFVPLPTGGRGNERDGIHLPRRACQQAAAEARAADVRADRLARPDRPVARAEAAGLDGACELGCPGRGTKRLAGMSLTTTGLSTGGASATT